MARAEQAIKDYGRKIGWVKSKEYKVTPTPILWHSENNKLISQAFLVLQSGLVVVPLIAGMDKFVNMIGHWSDYLAPAIPRVFNLSASTVLMIAGFAEIALSLGLALWPRVFSWMLMLWLGAVIANLLLLGQHYDIALRDFGLMVASFALWRLSLIKEEVPLVVAETEMEPPDLSSSELAH